MSGYEAEERIRAKAEAMLRRCFPDARIIHELVLEQGGVRIDLAAVTLNRLICVEIKSERDVLTRLPDQVAAMRLVSDAWRVVCADTHVEKVRKIAGWLETIGEASLDKPMFNEDSWLQRSAFGGQCNAPARLNMLWADELRLIRCPTRRANRTMCITAASDDMTGTQVRQAVCGALRQRAFPRADDVTGLAA